MVGHAAKTVFARVYLDFHYGHDVVKIFNYQAYYFPLKSNHNTYTFIKFVLFYIQDNVRLMELQEMVPPGETVTRVRCVLPMEIAWVCYNY